MKRELFRKTVRWLGILILAHIAALLFFGIALSSSVAHMTDDNPERVVKVVLAFNVVFDAIVLAYLAYSDLSMVELRRTMREDLKAGQLSVWKYFAPMEYAVKIGVVLVFQIPFVIFFANFGFATQNTTIFEQFFVMDAGCYLLTRSALGGWLLNTLLFGVIYAAIKLLFLWIGSRRLKDDM